MLDPAFIHTVNVDAETASLYLAIRHRHARRGEHDPGIEIAQIVAAIADGEAEHFSIRRFDRQGRAGEIGVQDGRIAAQQAQGFVKDDVLVEDRRPHNQDGIASVGLSHSAANRTGHSHRRGRGGSGEEQHRRKLDERQSSRGAGQLENSFCGPKLEPVCCARLHN